MDNTDKKHRALSSDELWAKAAQGGATSREELGIDKDSSSDGMTTLNEGVQKWAYGLYSDKKSKE